MTSATKNQEAPSDCIVAVHEGLLSELPHPWFLHGGSTVAVRIEQWSEGVFFAKVPDAALYGEGKDAEAAVQALAENIASFAEWLAKMPPDQRYGGAALRQVEWLRAHVGRRP